MSKLTNRGKLKGTLSDAITGADLFIGVSAANCVSKDMIKSMSENAVVFPMANPVPEISHDDAVAAGAQSWVQGAAIILTK